MPQMIPNFNDPEWDARRLRLQEEMGQAAERLLDHMAAPGGLKGKFEFAATDGRTILLTLEAGARPEAH